MHSRNAQHIASGVPNRMFEQYCRISNLWRSPLWRIVQISSNYLPPGKNYKVNARLSAHSCKGGAEKCLKIVRNRLVFSHRGGDRLLRQRTLVTEIHQGR